MILTPQWPVPAGVRAAFTSRAGGVSAAPYDTLNIGRHVGDADRAVQANRTIVRTALGLAREPAWLRQVHGVEVIDVRSTPVMESEPEADAAVSSACGGICVIQVADCMPVLFAARDGGTIAAAHAGWRGLAAGVLEATIKGMGVAPEDLTAWLGPAIGPANFEVGDEVREAFLSATADSCGRAAVSAAFVPNARGRWQCDLAALARLRLGAAGVYDVHGDGGCTFADAARFFSYRRDGRCGRMAALIWIEPGRA